MSGGGSKSGTQWRNGEDENKSGTKAEGRSSVIQVGAARSSTLVEALDAAMHAAIQVEAGGPAETFLEVVFRFWAKIGWELYSTSKGEKVGRGPTLFGVRDPPTVRLALEIWLSEAADLPSAAEVVPFLRLWFRDFEDPTPEVESHFYAQWHDYSKSRKNKT
jgi:hypothetical protein